MQKFNKLLFFEWFSIGTTHLVGPKKNLLKKTDLKKQKRFKI